MARTRDNEQTEGLPEADPTAKEDGKQWSAGEESSKEGAKIENSSSCRKISKGKESSLGDLRRGNCSRKEIEFCVLGGLWILRCIMLYYVELCGVCYVLC